MDHLLAKGRRWRHEWWSDGRAHLIIAIDGLDIFLPDHADSAGLKKTASRFTGLEIRLRLYLHKLMCPMSTTGGTMHTNLASDRP